MIKNKTDYRLVLTRIDQLMDAKAGSDEMDELELLTALVEMYEEKYYPINVPELAEVIKFRMENS